MAVRMINHNGFLLVEVPEGSCEILGSGLQLYTHKMSPEKHNELLNLFSKPYDIIGLAKDATEKQWRRIVENDANFGDSLTSIKFPYKNYQTFMLQCKTATESGHSLLKANNLNPDNCLILKKIL